MIDLLFTVALLVFGFSVVSVIKSASSRTERWIASADDDGIRGAYWRQLQTSSAPPSFDNSGAFMGSAHGGAEVLFDSIGSRTYVTQRGVVLEAEIVGPNLLRIVGPIAAPQCTPPTPSNSTPPPG